MYIRRTITPFYTSSSRKHQHLQSNSVKLQKFTENTTALIWWDLLTGGPSVIKTTRSITKTVLASTRTNSTPPAHVLWSFSMSWTNCQPAIMFHNHTAICVSRVCHCPLHRIIHDLRKEPFQSNSIVPVDWTLSLVKMFNNKSITEKEV